MSAPKHQGLSLGNIILLVIPTLLWASNAIVGRMVNTWIPPVTLNFLRWAIAFTVLLFFAYKILRRGSSLWSQWRRYAMLGLLGIGLYNALQYMALQTSTPINVTLVNASLPFWMLLIGRLFFRSVVSPRQLLGGLFSLFGVMIVLAQGDPQQLLSLRFVPGDIYMILATIAWAIYSWMLSSKPHPDDLLQHWSYAIFAQIFYGLWWSGLFAVGEWQLSDWQVQWSWPLVAAIVYVGVGPALIAFRCWGLAVQRVGAATAGFFVNLLPIFAALLSVLVLGESPRPYHGLAFLLVVLGIVISSRGAVNKSS